MIQKLPGPAVNRLLVQEPSAGQGRSSQNMPDSKLLQKLQGGDFRSIGRADEVVADVLNDLFSAINYWGYLISEHRDRESVAKYKFANIQRFIDMFKLWEHDPDTIEPSIFDYLNRITLASRDDISDDSDTGKLNLMTIHAAKGLEFSIVFIAGVEDRFLPHKRALDDDPENIEEEREKGTI